MIVRRRIEEKYDAARSMFFNGMSVRAVHAELVKAFGKGLSNTMLVQLQSEVKGVENEFNNQALKALDYLQSEKYEKLVKFAKKFHRENLLF